MIFGTCISVRCTCRGMGALSTANFWRTLVISLLTCASYRAPARISVSHRDLGSDALSQRSVLFTQEPSVASSRSPSPVASPALSHTSTLFNAGAAAAAAGRAALLARQHQQRSFADVYQTTPGPLGPTLYLKMPLANKFCASPRLPRAPPAHDRGSVFITYAGNSRSLKREYGST